MCFIVSIFDLSNILPITLFLHHPFKTVMLCHWFTATNHKQNLRINIKRLITNINEKNTLNIYMWSTVIYGSKIFCQKPYICCSSIFLLPGYSNLSIVSFSKKSFFLARLEFIHTTTTYHSNNIMFNRFV